MKHKYGFHVNRTGADVLDAVRRIKPRVVKVLDHNVDFCREVRAIVPDVLLIGRLVVTPQEQDRFDQDPAGTGRAFAERILGLEANRVTVGGRKLVDAWESYNEVMAGNASDERKKRYDDFQVAFAGPIKAAGYQPIAMNFATGNMLASDFLTHFRGTLETHEYLGFHEYDWPAMWRLHEKNIREKNEGGMWLALRYRRIMEEVRQHYPGRHRVLITECGMTQGVLGGADVGWRHPPTVPAHVLQYLKERNIDPNVTEERYWNSLLWYNGELMKDDYVSAALLYVVGAVHPWESFEHLGGILNRLEAFQESEPDGPPAEGSLEEKLLAAAAEAQVIQFNPKAALQKRLFADGFVPNSPEFEVEHERVTYVAQRAEHLGTGEVRVYYVPKGDWAQVAYIRRGKGEEIILT
jgi:hypothetical protein